MAKLNLAQIRRQNANALKKYERFGVKLFTKALKEQAQDFDPKIMQDAYLEFYTKVFVDSAKKEYNRIRVREKVFTPSDFFLSVWTNWIKDWVRSSLSELVQLVNDNTFNIIQETLADAIEQGLNPFETARLLSRQVGSVARARAIARTESTRANAMGKERSATEWANETGQNLWKIWVWGGSREPRIEHVELQNKPIRKEDNFIGINGKPLSKPGDLSGGPENTINCSCTVVYVSERFARRNYPEAFNGQPVVPENVFKEPVFLGDQQLIDRHKDRIIESIKELGITRKLEFNFINNDKGFSGAVDFQKNSDGSYRISNKITVDSKLPKGQFLAVVKHELRHIYQSDFDGLMIQGGQFFYKNEKIISIQNYNKILKDIEKGDKKAFMKYMNLPWEKDADEYAGLDRFNKSVEVGEFFIADLIKLPYELTLSISLD